MQHVLRYIGAIEENTTAGFLEQDLEDCPAEFQSVPALIGLHIRGRTLIKALMEDELAGSACQALNEAAFQGFLQEVTEALEQERRQLQRGHLHAWRERVREAEREHKGWAHRWSASKEQWKPVRVPAAAGGQRLSGAHIGHSGGPPLEARPRAHTNMGIDCVEDGD